MTIGKKRAFEIDHRFDDNFKRHYINDVCTVLHCHHYAVLCTQLAIDAADYDGMRHLVEASEDVFFKVLDRYCKCNRIEIMEDRIKIAEHYWAAVGMGKIRFTAVGDYEVLAEMEYSHIDEGWLKKMERPNRPVNFFSAGFVAAVAALVHGKLPRSFQVKETHSLACGDEKSRFQATIR